MNHLIQKERIHLMSPCANVAAVAVLPGTVPETALQTALDLAVERNRILCARVEVSPDGTACFTESGAPLPALSSYTGGASQLIVRQEAVPFRLDQGETLRFFCQHRPGSTELIAIAHHLVCDGGSLIRFLGDFLAALNGQPLPERPIRLLTPADLPRHPGLNPLMCGMMNRTNRRWARTGRSFFLADARVLPRTPAALTLRKLSGPELDRLKSQAHAWNITLNSLLSAAPTAVMEPGEGLGIAVDVRPREIDGMGNFATGISVKAACDPRRSLEENARRLHGAIQKKLRSPRDKFFLYEFMSAMAPTLIDAIWFTRSGSFQNPLSEAVCRMCGYTAAPAGVSLTNLKTLRLPDLPEGRYRYGELYFVPPYIPNVRAVMGISTYDDAMILTLRTAGDPDARLLDAALTLLLQA